MTYYNTRGLAMPLSAPEQARIAGTSAGNETINAPAGHSSLSGEGGGDLLIGNNLDNRHWITDPKDQVVEQPGGGIDTMIGWTSLKLAPNVENLQVNGQLNYAVGNDLGNLIIVDDNTHFVWGAGGDDVLVGGAIQRTTFMVRAGEGSDVIYNWNGNSQLQLWGYEFDNGTEIKAAMTQDGDDVVLKLSDTETLTFRDETLQSFQDRQFLLPLDTSQLGNLTFHDEFDSLQVYDHSLETGQWRADFGGNLRDEWAYTLTSNGERQVYTTKDFYGQGERQFDNYTPLSVSDGVLTIKAERLADSDREAAWGREYSSGMLNTYGIFEQQYGYFEMRAELPSAMGAWPAFWMIPFPYAAQIEADIMEGLAATPNVDYRRAWGGSENLYDNGYKVDPTGMHTYGMLWTPSQVTFYFDGVAVMQTTTPANWDQPMAMIVNLAVGGWGGEPNSLQYPAEMKIDYVRAYELADGSTITETGTPEPPAATLRGDGGLTSGEVNVPVAFEGSGKAVTDAEIAVYDARPTDLPPGQTFVIWEDSGAVFGAVSNGQTLGDPTALMAGDSRVFTGSGTWLTDGKVALAYMAPDGGQQTAWVMIFDPAKATFTKHELGVSRGDIDIVALKNGGFAASWEAPDGQTMGRAFDAFAYDGKGWYGPARAVVGDFTGVTADGEVIATTGSGAQQLYDVINPPRGVNAVVSIGPMAGVTHEEGDAAGTLYTFTVIRDWDQSEKVTVGWQVRGQGANPATALDFEGGVLPAGTVTFEINQTTAYVQVWVAGDTTAEANEEFLVTLVNPVGAKLGQATATGFITDDDSGGGDPPPAAPTLAFAQNAISLAEGNSGATAFTYTVTRSGATAEASSVDWSVAGSGDAPASAADFSAGALPSGTLTFAAGETSKTITIEVAGDTAAEPDEGFTLTLSGASGATIDGATATGTITNDDTSTPPPSGSGQVYNSPGPGSTVTAGAGDDTLNASQGNDTLTGGAGADTFAFKALPWSAGKITDFVVGEDRIDLSAIFQSSGYTGTDPIADGRMTLEADGGGTRITFDRDGAGGDWPFTVTTLQGVSPTGLTWAQLSGDGTTTPPPSGGAILSLTNSDGRQEGDPYSTLELRFTVTRSGDVSGASTAAWSVAGSGANPANAGDFANSVLPSGTVSFAAGETSKTIVVNINGDKTVEPDETFTLTLASPSAGSTIGTATAQGTIVNDDYASPGEPPQIGFDVTARTLAEGSSGSTAFTYTLSRSGTTEGASSVNWAVAGTGANPASASDFVGGTLPSGTVTFAAGEVYKTITIQVAGDALVEPDEAFAVTLSGASGAGLRNLTATGTITNDDTSTPPPSGSGQVYNSPGPGSTVTAGAGDDTLNASQGNDTLTGGAGADTFAFKALPWSAGKITDFVVGEDRIDLSAVFQASGYEGTDPIADGRMTLEADGGGTRITFDRDGAGGDWPFTVTTLQGVSPTGLTWAQLSGDGTTTPPPAAGSQVALTTTTLSLAEGNSGATAFVFTVARTGADTGTSSVTWTVAGSGSSPASAADFTGAALPSGTLTFAAGETSKTITVNVAGDTVAEPAETFTLTLAAPSSGTTLGTATATGTITNDDAGAPPPSGSGQVFTSQQPGDTLTGTAGNDTLNASQGPDRLIGGGGADHFVFDKPVWNAGQITDFVSGTDKVDLRGLFDQAGYTGTDPVADGWLIVQQGDGGIQLIVDMDGPTANGGWPITITTLTGVTQVSTSDWIVQ